MKKIEIATNLILENFKFCEEINSRSPSSKESNCLMDLPLPSTSDRIETKVKSPDNVLKNIFANQTPEIKRKHCEKLESSENRHFYSCQKNKTFEISLNTSKVFKSLRKGGVNIVEGIRKIEGNSYLARKQRYLERKKHEANENLVVKEKEFKIKVIKVVSKIK